MRACLLMLLCAACSLQHQQSGVLMEAATGAKMMGQDGREWRLVPGEHAPVLQRASGVSIQVAGPRLGHRLWVRDWTITDGGDGAAPYVGTLTRFGGQWVMEDLNSGSTIVFVEASLGDLRVHEGRLVMISGYVVGAHRVNAVRWTLLD